VSQQQKKWERMTEVRSSVVAFRFFGLKYYNEASNLSPFSRGELGRRVQVVRSRCQEKKVDTADPRTKKDEAYGRRECVSVGLGEREDSSLIVDKKVLRAVPESMRRTVRKGESKTDGRHGEAACSARQCNAI
jgi:hypothetical protein